MRTALARALSVEDVNQLGRDTGQSARLRKVTPHRLFLSMIAALSDGRVESLADLLREFNHQNRVTVAYKAFYNRLARPGFAIFMRQMFVRLIERLRIRMLEPEGHAAVSRFTDIVIQDGSSFVLKDALRHVFSGRFTNVDPAAVELHATYSGFSDEVSTVSLAPDSEAERQFLPAPSTLRGQLLLADRGYPSTSYFDEVREHGGSFIVRLSRSHDPYVLGAWLDGRRQTPRKPTRLSRFIERHLGTRMDLDVEYDRTGLRFRVVVLPGREQTMTRLCTNLPRSAFSLALVSKLYRFWASLCAAVLKRLLAHAAELVGGRAMSTRRVAMCSGHIIDQLAAALLACLSIATAFRDGLEFLLANAQRSNPARDHKTGRLRTGLVSVAARP
jgi:hypothetical protein